MRYDFKKIHKFLLENSSSSPELKRIISSNGVLDIPFPKFSFKETIFQTIISQQISNQAADKIWNRVYTFFKKRPGNFYFKSNDLIYRKLHSFGVSKRKLDCMTLVFEKYPNIQLVEKKIRLHPITDFKNELKSIKGVGEWTCNMILIFYFRKINIWPETDFIINKYSKKMTKTNNETIDYLTTFSPYLSILALHLWKYSDQNH